MKTVSLRFKGLRVGVRDSQLHGLDGVPSMIQAMGYTGGVVVGSAACSTAGHTIHADETHVHVTRTSHTAIDDVTVYCHRLAGKPAAIKHAANNWRDIAADALREERDHHAIEIIAAEGGYEIWRKPATPEECLEYLERAQALYLEAHGWQLTLFSLMSQDEQQTRYAALDAHQTRYAALDAHQRGAGVAHLGQASWWPPLGTRFARCNYATANDAIRAQAYDGNEER